MSYPSSRDAPHYRSPPTTWGGRYAEDTYAPARTGDIPQPTSDEMRGSYPHSRTSEYQPLHESINFNDPETNEREYDRDEDDRGSYAGGNYCEYGSARDVHVYERGEEADNPPFPRGNPTALEGRGTPCYRAPPASGAGRYAGGGNANRAYDNLPPTRRDEERRRLLQNKFSGYEPLPKSLTYNGTGNWRAFLRKFDSFAKVMQWSYAQRLDELRWCMEGRANDFIDLVLGREPRLNYLEVVERMERRFDYQEPPESAQLEFSTARQGANEPLLDWADRVYVLAARAFPGVQEAYRQRQAVLRLCQGCADKEAGCYALDCQPVTIDEAIEAMLNWYQHSRRVFYGRARPAKVMALSSGKMITPPRQPDRGVGMLPSPKLERRVTNSEETVTTRAEKVDLVGKKLDWLMEQVASLQSEADSKRMQPPISYTGGAAGHFKTNCPRLIRTSSEKSKVTCGGAEESVNSCGSEEEATLRPGEEMAHYK